MLARTPSLLSESKRRHVKEPKVPICDRPYAQSLIRCVAEGETVKAIAAHHERMGLPPPPELGCPWLEEADAEVHARASA